MAKRARDRREIAADLFDALKQAERIAAEGPGGYPRAFGWLHGNVIRCILDLQSIHDDDVRRREAEDMRARLARAAEIAPPTDLASSGPRLAPARVSPVGLLHHRAYEGCECLPGLPPVAGCPVHDPEDA